jgi:hypothetical protein
VVAWTWPWLLVCAYGAEQTQSRDKLHTTKQDHLDL